MNIGELLESRKVQWQELEELLSKFQSLTYRFSMSAEDVSRFTALYRGVCADLALSEAYQLPGGVVQYLNDLVGRAHNRLYRDQTVTVGVFLRYMATEAPRVIFGDACFWVAMLIFWAPFFFCFWQGAVNPDFAPSVLGQDHIDSMESMYKEPLWEHQISDRAAMVGFYIYNNAGIGVLCFATGILAAIPGIFITFMNAISIGTSFGHMYSLDSAIKTNFFEFVTAHGPFELMAVVMAAGAGMRLGFAWVSTNGLSRGDSVRKAALERVPVICTAVLLFCMAAFIEGFISPSNLEIPNVLTSHAVKIGIAILSSALLFFYIVIIGGTGYLAHKREEKYLEQKRKNAEV